MNRNGLCSALEKRIRQFRSNNGTEEIQFNFLKLYSKRQDN